MPCCFHVQLLPKEMCLSAPGWQTQPLWPVTQGRGSRAPSAEWAGFRRGVEGPHPPCDDTALAELAGRLRVWCSVAEADNATFGSFWGHWSKFFAEMSGRVGNSHCPEKLIHSLDKYSWSIQCVRCGSGHWGCSSEDELSCPRALCSRVERQTLRKTSKAGGVCEGGGAAKNDPEKREGQGSHDWAEGKERPVRTPRRAFRAKTAGPRGTAQGALGGGWGESCCGTAR